MVFDYDTEEYKCEEGGGMIAEGAELEHGVSLKLPDI